jgi:signal transduction histidine kinase/DNA-binding response OmpR family regulator
VDQAYRSFLGLLAAQLASGIAGTRAYEAERQRAEGLAQLDAAKTAFFTNVSHELRTPLTLLLGPAEDALADSQSLPEPHRHRLEIIARNGHRLLGLVNKLLDFSRLESGHASASFEPVELSHFTAELASMFESAVTQAGLEFVVDCAPLSERIYVDKEMWAKIVLNLLSNALKFTFSGAITVRLEQLDAFVRLAVSDSGIGIEQSEHARLFERFHRVPGARGRTYEGSGVGLALVAELVNLHGGHAAVQSAVGAGSTFTVEIPLGRDHISPGLLAQVPAETSVEQDVAVYVAEARRWLRPSSPYGVTATTDAADLAGRPRVLIADDNADMRDYVAGLLTERYSVRTAVDGVTALEQARAEPPDLVLTDVMMPRLDGFGLLLALRADPATVDVPVVMLSARAGEDGVVEGLQAGADDYLIKPFSARELLARVHTNLELERTRRARDALHRSQRLLDQAERLAEMGSWEIDLATGLIAGSEQLRRILRRSDLRNVRADDEITRLVHPDDQPLVRAVFETAIATRQRFEYEVRLVHDQGEERLVRVVGEVLCNERRDPIALRGLIQDISERRKAEHALMAAASAREAAAREHAIAEALQRSLLPASTLTPEQLEVASYYQAGVEGTQVGGDWFDTIELGAGRTALVIGDVVGRGVVAASVMGQLRAAVRAYARLDLPPADLLELLDAAVQDLGSGQIVTCIYAVYDPVRSEIVYANAGHLPPLLTVPGHPTRRLPSASGPPLGVWSRGVAEHRISVPPGAILTLYTDGLVERRDRDLDIGIDAVAALLHADSPSIEQLTEQVVRALAPEGSEDDIAILIARASGNATQKAAVMDVPARPSALHEGRQFTIATLRSWSVSTRIIDDAVLIVSELLTNAIVHGRPPIQLRLRRTSQEVAIEVDDGASAMPRRLRVTPDEPHGRGLAIVAKVGDRWAARANGRGKTVWSTLSAPQGSIS